MMINWKNLVEILSACLTPIVAIVGSIIAIVQCQLAFKKRKDDLFDRRYAFYKMIEKFWLLTCEPVTPTPEVEAVISAAEEASFIFGKDISDHILSLAGKRHEGSPFIPNDDFVKPF